MEISLHDSNNESDEPKKSKEELKNRQEKTEKNKTTVAEMQVSCTEIKINNYYKQQTRFVHSFRSSKIHNQQLAFSNNRYSTATRYITYIDFFLRRDLVLYFFVDRSSNINLLTKKGQKFRELSVHKYSENMIKKILHKDNLKKKNPKSYETPTIRIA